MDTGNKKIIELFIGQALATQVIPFAEWNTRLFPLVEQFNAIQTPPIEAQELCFIFDSIVSEEKEKQAEQNRDSEEEEIRKEFAKNKTKATHRLANFITKKYDIITVGEKEREMFVYRNGVYVQAENLIIYPEIQRVLNDQTTRASKGETFSKIADMTHHERSVFETAEYKYIPVKNGVYNLETGELLPHDSKYRFLFQLSLSYNPKADCPRTKDFLAQVLDEEQQKTVQEWLGYYFYRYYMFKKAIIFVGEGDTGKTTLLEVIINLLGKENTSSVSLQKMASDKFSAAHLYNKHGNLVDELSAKDITDTGYFKMATGGGSITGEYKFGNQFSFQNFSKFTFACNKIPDVTDFDDLAYFNRWMVIRFEKTIAKKIPNFILTLTTEEERSGLFNYAMEGLARLLTNGEFSYKKDAMETKKEMMRSGSSIAMFSAERIERQDGVELTKEEMYEAYTQFCNEKGLATETLKMLGTRLPFYVTYLLDGVIDGLDGKGKPARVRGWRNAKVKGNMSTGNLEMDKEVANF